MGYSKTMDACLSQIIKLAMIRSLHKVAIRGVITLLMFALLFFPIALAAEFEEALFEDAFLSDRNGRKVLHLTSGAIEALKIAEAEAQSQNVDVKQLKSYMFVFEKDRIYVFFAPPYRGGLDGPEFRVEMRRSDLKVLSVINTLEVK